MSGRTTLTAIVLGFAFIAGLGVAALRAEDGQSIFQSLRCSACHKPDQKTAAVSLAEISKTYQDPVKLVSFFKGEGRPMIETARPGMMRGQMSGLSALSDHEKHSLAEYVLSFK